LNSNKVHKYINLQDNREEKSFL